MLIRKNPLKLLVRGAVLGMLVGLAGAPHAADPDPYRDYRGTGSGGGFDYDDSGDIPWIENETEVLAMPQAENLSPVGVDALPRGMTLLIDRSRITVDPKDRVVRVWLWLRSDQGAESGSFEGYRCETREYKVYAYANPRRDPPVSKAKAPTWLSAKSAAGANYRLELLNDYFCGIRGARTAQEIGVAMTGEFRLERFFSN
jgi:hypothetical protein